MVGCVAVFELDSVEGSFLASLIDAGLLPAMSRLRDRSTRIPLVSDAAYCSEYPPTGFLTGQPSEVSRYWSMVTFDPATYTCRRVGSAEREPFYALGSRASVIAFDVPHSIISPNVVGSQIVGWGGHDARFQYPRVSSPTALMSELDQRFGTDPSRWVEWTGQWWQPDYLERLADSLVESTRRRTAIATWLLRENPSTDVFLMGIPEGHALGHAAGHAMLQTTDLEHPLASHPSVTTAREQLIRVFRAIDDLIGTIVGALPADATVCAFSPKGMEATRTDVAGPVLVPELLARLGGVALLHEPTHESWRAEGCPLLISDRGVNTWLDARRVDRNEHSVRHFVGSHLPRPARQMLRAARNRKKTGGGGIEDRGLERHPPTWYRSRWPTLDAFALPSFSDAHIRINLEGRERDGRVALRDYEKVCDRIDAEVRAAVDVRTGQPLVNEVLRLRDDDPLVSDGPGADLVVRFAVPSDAIEHPRVGTIGPFPFPRSGSHTPNGFAFLAQPDTAPHEARQQPAYALPGLLLELIAGRSFEPV